MTEEIKIDEKFQKSALFDLEFEGREQKSAEYAQKDADSATKFVEMGKEKEQKFASMSADLSDKTSTLSIIHSKLKELEKYDPKLKAQAETYLSDLINKDRDQFAIPSRKEKKGKETVDLDGSKKSLWGKLKNKAKNIWRPNNLKHSLERNIEKLKSDMEANPSTYEWLKKCARPENKAYDSSEKVSFSQLYEKTEEIQKNYNNERIKGMKDKESFSQWKEERTADVAKHEATIEAIHQVRDNAAKEMEQRSTARDTTGIKDTNANTGVDRLAEKAKAMEGLSPEQRLAKRMAEMRGTKKPDAPKPVVKREVDSNIMNRTMDNKMRA